jgi:hypothetical protein
MNHSLSLAAINCNRKNVHGYNMTENKDINFWRYLTTRIIESEMQKKDNRVFQWR